MSDKELMDMAKGLHESINVSECYGTKDHWNYEGVCYELEKRGYKMSEERSLVIRKQEESVIALPFLFQHFNQ
jgi:hypothetical protein